MTIDFFGEKFDQYERLNSKAYIGYFAPEGKLVDYNTALGGSHCALINIVSWTFLLWIKQSDLFHSLGIQNIKISSKLDLNTGIIKGNSSLPNNNYNISTNLLFLQKDLISFLKKVESDERIINIIKSKINYSKIPGYIREDKNLPLHYFGNNGQESLYEIESVFGCYNTKELLLFLKDICVQYLGYDSIEQFKPNGEQLVFPKYYLLYPKSYYDYFQKPRIITTTAKNINERFFNYLLMDWAIHKIPKFIYNTNLQRFEEESETNEFYTNEVEKMLDMEINSIKKLVPLRERPKYFKN